MTFIIEICPNEGSAQGCTMSGDGLLGTEFESDIMDCNKSGDCEPACEFVRDQLKPEFRIVAKDANGKYENRIATAKEKQATCEEIYFESETDFSDESTAETYLIWQMACNLECEWGCTN